MDRKPSDEGVLGATVPSSAAPAAVPPPPPTEAEAPNKAPASDIEGDLGSQDRARLEPLPARVGDYVIVGRLPGGGMADVLVAHKMSRFGYVRRAVIKRVSRSRPGYRNLQRMLLDEARATAFLDHPNVVSILDVDEDEQGIYIALEYVEGTDLRWVNAKLRARREALPFELACFMTSEVLRGLHHAHAATDADGKPLEIVHRDVNPSNVLISVNGHVKLTDFGVVRMRQRVQQHTEAGLVKGKYGYLAPEYIAGEPCTQRSDLYSTGVMLFELLTGRECFSGATTYEVMWKIVNRGVPYYRLERESVPEDLSRIIQKATSPLPERRYASAQEMANALETWLIRHSKHATPWVLSVFFRRHKLYPQLEDEAPVVSAEAETPSDAAPGLGPRPHAPIEPTPSRPPAPLALGDEPRDAAEPSASPRPVEPARGVTPDPGRGATLDPGLRATLDPVELATPGTGEESTSEPSTGSVIVVAATIEGSAEHPIATPLTLEPPADADARLPAELPAPPPPEPRTKPRPDVHSIDAASSAVLEGELGLPSELPTDPLAARAASPLAAPRPPAVPSDRALVEPGVPIPIALDSPGPELLPTLPSIPRPTSPKTPRPRASSESPTPVDVGRAAPRMPSERPSAGPSRSGGEGPRPPERTPLPREDTPNARTEPRARGTTPSVKRVLGATITPAPSRTTSDIRIEEPEDVPVYTDAHADDPTPPPMTAAIQPRASEPWSGRLEEIEPAVALEALSRAGASGRLEFRCGLIWKRIQLEQGAPQAITSNMGMELIGEHLVKARLITRRELDRALHASEREGVQLTAKLIEFGLIEKSRLEEELGSNLSARLSEVLEWRWGTFEFTPQAVEPTTVRPRLDLDAVLARALAASALAEAEEPTPPVREAEGEQARLKEAFQRARSIAESTGKGRVEDLGPRPTRQPTPKR